MNRPDAHPRAPEAVRPHRMAALATLPVFFKLTGQRVVVAGGNEAAAWKAELIAAAGATVVVVDPQPCPELEILASDPPGGSVVLERRPWSADDFAGATLVIGAAGDESDAARIHDAARNTGVPVKSEDVV